MVEGGWGGTKIREGVGRCQFRPLDKTDSASTEPLVSMVTLQVLRATMNMAIFWDVVIYQTTAWQIFTDVSQVLAASVIRTIIAKHHVPCTGWEGGGKVTGCPSRGIAQTERHNVSATSLPNLYSGLPPLQACVKCGRQEVTIDLT